MKLNFLLILILLFLFSGCSEEKLEYKNACLSLTSYSFQEIPECSSQEDCFKEVEKHLFDFKQTFSFESSDKLHSYKNNLASSWLYFNKSLKLVKELNRLCYSDDFSFLPEKTNELVFSLEKAFEFSDKASLDSFSFLLTEKNFLNKQNIELIPEELLFDDFILFNHNLNELSTPEIYKSSGSYVSKYFNASAEFNDFSSKFGFYSLYLNEFTSSDLINFYQKDALDSVKSNKFYVPLMKKTFSSVSSFIFGLNDLKRTVSVLNSIPSNKLFFLYGNFVSPKNSVASEFSLLVKKVSEHKLSLNESNNSLVLEIESDFNEISFKLDELSVSSVSRFDSNITSFLFEELNASFISENKNEIFSAETFVFESRKKLSLLKSKFNELKRKDSFNEISLGKKSSLLKQIKAETLSLKEDIGFFAGAFIDELIVLCSTKTELISSELNQKDFSSFSWEITSLASRTAVKIDLFEDASKEQKIIYCKDTILLKKQLDSALENQEKFLLSSSESLNECISSLEKIFYSKNLSVFVDSFYSLKSMQKNRLPFSYLLDSCSDLKKRITVYLYSYDEEIIQANDFYIKSEKILSNLSFLSKIYPEFFNSVKTTNFISDFDEISLDFSLKKLKPEFFPFSSEKLSLIKKFNQKINSFFSSSFGQFLSFNYSIKSFPLEQAVLGKTFLVKQKIFFPNPLNEPINLEFSFLSPFLSSENKLIHSCIKEITKSKSNSRILVSCFPEEGLLFESDKNLLLSFFDSFPELIEANQNSVLFSKSLKIDSFSQISSLKAVVPLEFNSDNAFAVFNSQKIPVEIKEKNAVFYLEELNSEPLIELFFSVSKPVSFEFSEKSRKKLDENTFLVFFDLQLKNNLAFDFDSIKIFLPLNDSDSILEAKLTDFSSEIKVYSLGKKFFFKTSLNKLESKKFFLEIKIKDFDEYKKSLKNSLLSEISLIEDPVFRKNFQTKINSADSFEELIELNAKLSSFLEEKNSFMNSEFLSLKSLVEEKITGLKETVAFFDSTGFYSESNELKSKILKAESDLIKAVSVSKEKGTELLLSVNSFLEEVSDKNLEAFLLNKRNFVLEKTAGSNELIALLNSKKIFDLKNALLEQDTNFLSFFSKKDYFNSALSLNLMQSDSKKLLELISKEIQLKKQKLNEKKIFFKEKKQLTEMLFSSLENALSESKFYLSPISKSRLKFLRNEFDSINFSFKDSSSPESLLSAELLAEQSDKELNAIHEELSFSLNKLKEDAKVFLLSAKISGKNISSAQTLFEEGKYIDSINASFFSAESSPTAFAFLSSFEVPLQVYPLLIIILFVAGKKFFIKKKKKRKPKKKHLKSLE